MKKQIMSLEILKKGLEIIKTMPEKEPLLTSPLTSLNHPLGWESVVSLLILQKGFNFGEVTQKLKEAWPEALTAKQGAGEDKNADKEICSEQALRRQVIKVAMQRYGGANAKLEGKLTPKEKVEQQRIIDEVKKLYNVLGLELPGVAKTVAPVANEKTGNDVVKAVSKGGIAGKAGKTVIKTTTGGESPKTVDKESKTNSDDLTTVDIKKKGSDTISPAAPPIETLSLPAVAETAVPVADQKTGNGDVKAVPEVGNADKSTIADEKTTTGGQGEPLTLVGEESKSFSADLTTVDGKQIGSDMVPPASPSIDTPSWQKPKIKDGDEGKGGQDEDKFPCPVCGGKMEVRTAKKGKYKGQPFLGCEAFPKCRGTRDIVTGPDGKNN